ncbi:hypothetical protein [Haliovirga abyssi]|uniref:Uncharacterized protein n=1 Tax=Haliovirga abyssi TaxID=2996794 RepID=A0AAU9DDR8_9FUSO|nr:hypothetical protein [Haliovirga abyssi]BDU51666.1 hypothetical protein HLVA_22350 [Haliovirga abyssi]
MITKIDLMYIGIIISFIVYTDIKPLASTLLLAIYFAIIGFSYSVIRILMKNIISFEMGLIKLIIIVISPILISMLISKIPDAETAAISFFLLIFISGILAISYTLGYFIIKLFLK